MDSNEYKCAMCGNVYTKEQSDDDAMKECIENFGALASMGDVDVICDDCYNMINPANFPELVKEVVQKFADEKAN